jgi:hypothetical protein
MTFNLPKYTIEKQKGNIGEALVQYLLSDFCLVHKIDGSNDVGNDFICELIRDQSPTNLLFYVQVKYTKNKPRIKKETLEYWKTSPIPVYIFWIKDKIPPRAGIILSPDHFKDVQKMYKRCTPVVHNEIKHKNEDYKIFERKKFKRDLIIDYTRTQYKKGFAPVVQPRDFLTLEEKKEIGFPQYQFLINDVIKEYTKEIIAGGWSNLFSLAVSIIQNDSSINDNRLVQQLLIMSKELLERDEHMTDKKRFINLINEYIKRIHS